MDNNLKDQAKQAVDQIVNVHAEKRLEKATNEIHELKSECECLKKKLKKTRKEKKRWKRKYMKLSATFKDNLFSGNSGNFIYTYMKEHQKYE